MGAREAGQAGDRLTSLALLMAAAVSSASSPCRPRRPRRATGFLEPWRSQFGWCRRRISSNSSTNSSSNSSTTSSSGHLLPQGAGQWHGEAVDGGAAEHWARAAAEPRRGAASFSREPFRLGAVGEPWGNAVLEEQQLRAAAQAQVVSGATMDFTGKSGMAPAAAAQPAAPLEETLVWRAVSVLHHKRGTALVYLPPTCAPCR